MRILLSPVLPLCLLTTSAASGAISISGLADKTKYNDSVTFTVTADPAAVTTTATLDGAPVLVGSAVQVTAISYHELSAESRDGGGALIDSRTVRFIVRNNAERGGTEDGIPTFTPFRSVNDAPSAFAGQTLKVIAPSAWPIGFPIPIAAVLRSPEDEPLWLNGTVGFAGLPQTPLQLRRGWGSILAPAATTAGVLELGATVNGLEHNPSISIENAPVFTQVSGTLSASTTWPANSRIHVTGTLTIDPGVTLTVGAGTIVMISTGTSTNGSAAEIVVNGTLQINGVEGNPVAFVPDTPGENWGGIELPAATSVVNAAHTIFTGSGEDGVWFDNDGGYGGPSHRPEQALFLVVGSGSGTSIGAQLHLTDCYCFSLAGQQMNSKEKIWIDLNRTLMQRCITCGEISGAKVTIDRSALIEFPDESEDFADGDNDAIYLTNGDLSISRTVIGYTKDDGVDSGGSGGNSPFGTVDPDTGNTVTRFDSTDNWYEGIVHEGNSLSGTRNVYFTGCVFLNCGQGVEAGYSNGSTSDGPHALVDDCLFAGNMVGVRWGDNYGSGYSYNSATEVRNSYVLSSIYRDAFSGQWHPTQANAWIYQTTALNSFGNPYFNVHTNYLSQPDPVHHPSNTAWNPSLDGALIEPFMPVPGSNVGVAISSYDPAQSPTAAYPGTFTVRLSTFSSRQVSVDYAVFGKSDPSSNAEVSLGGGSLVFESGQTLKTISPPPVANPGSYSILRVALQNPVNAEVTGEAWYFSVPAGADPNLVARGASGWRYRETRNDPPANWKQSSFDDSSPAATEWKAATLPAGYGYTVATTVDSGPSGARTTAFYFRKKFNVPNPSAIASLIFRVRRDDGAIAWLNDNATPIANSADGAGSVPTPATYATLSPNASDSATYFEYSVPIALLVTGTNILAVEVHQSSLTSSDLLLDCELIATYTSDTPLQLELDSLGGQSVLYWFDAEARLESTSDFTGWKPVPAALSPYSLLHDLPRNFFRLAK